MKKIVVFHHNDNDGKAAAAVIYHALDDFEKEMEWEFISVNYNDSIPTADKVEKDDDVYIVDYSFTNATVDNLIKITEKANSVIWFDHHKSSLEVYNKIKEMRICKECIVTTEMCGAMITYKYFIDRVGIKMLFLKGMEDVIRLVDDYDRWIHADPDSLLFNIGSEMYDTDPTSTFWGAPVIRQVIDEGQTIKKYNDMKNTKLTKSKGFIIKINDHECIVLNTPEASSKAFGDCMDDYNFAIRFVFNGKNYEYSIYSTLEDIDCAKIAQFFNPKGGGHKGAAGFVSDKLIFSDQSVFVI